MRRGGPLISDVHRRTVWSLSKGKLIDDCLADDVSDETLNRYLDSPDDIRIELTMKAALDIYERSGADVAEIYPRPRIAQAAAEYEKNGKRPRTGRSLVLTRSDPATGLALDFSKPSVQTRVVKLMSSTTLLFVIGPSPCRPSRHC